MGLINILCKRISSWVGDGFQHTPSINHELLGLFDVTSPGITSNTCEDMDENLKTSSLTWHLKAFHVGGTEKIEEMRHPPG